MVLDPNALDITTPINVKALALVLEEYDKDKAMFLINGFSKGFEIHFEGSPMGHTCNNLKSAIEMPEVVDKKLKKELEAGRIAGPFVEPPFPNMHISPLGVVPKKIEGQFRLIHHLSYPNGSSVNDGIPEEYSSVQYHNIQDAISFIKHLPNAFLAKTDIESAFRIIPIHPSQRHLLGFKWKNQFYYDKCLPMGLAESCRIFEAFSTAIEWAAYRHCKASAIVHVLDDFLFIESSLSQCAQSLQNFTKLCSEIGVPLAPDKTFGPDQVMPFLGITLDTILQEARLPLDKLDECRNLCRAFQNKKKITLKELQSIIGKLQFATSVVVPGRPFLRRLIDLTKGIRKPSYKIRLNSGGRADLNMWSEFLDRFNGKSFFLSDTWLTSDTLSLYTDASSTIGYGAVFGNSWFSGTWNLPCETPHINILELYPIVVALVVWAAHFSQKAIWLFTDNLSLVSIINNQTSRDPQIMALIRILVLNCLQHNIMVRATHIPGAQNVLADALSRSQVELFKTLLPSADRLPTTVPSHLKPAALFQR